jgi:hypothetical protein
MLICRRKGMQLKVQRRSPSLSSWEAALPRPAGTATALLSVQTRAPRQRGLGQKAPQLAPPHLCRRRQSRRSPARQQRQRRQLLSRWQPRQTRQCLHSHSPQQRQQSRRRRAHRHLPLENRSLQRCFTVFLWHCFVSNVVHICQRHGVLIAGAEAAKGSAGSAQQHVRRHHS